MNEPAAMLINQVPGHLLATGEGPQQRDRRGPLFCYGAANDVPGRAQNGVGPFSVLSLNREIADNKK
jgi:hypothetical protein